ncbi:hypothetical protein JANET_249 [Bacillus phage Janet]|nr:hypothetical protein JANET_249 [Bacillus phage Janet]
MSITELKLNVKWGRGALTVAGAALVVCSGYMIYTDAPTIMNFIPSFTAGGCFATAHTLHKCLKKL